MRRFGGFQDCGCCACEDCCNNDAPDDVLIDLAFDEASGDMGCQRCVDMLTGAFTVSRGGIGNYGSAYCDWLYSHLFNGIGDVGICVDLALSSYPATGFALRDLSLIYKVRCISSTMYRVELEATQRFSIFPGFSGDPTPPDCCYLDGIQQNCTVWNVYTWAKDLAMASWDCRTPCTLDFVERWCACAATGSLDISGLCDPGWYPCELSGAGTVSVTPL